MTVRLSIIRGRRYQKDQPSTQLQLTVTMDVDTPLMELLAAAQNAIYERSLKGETGLCRAPSDSK